MKGIVVIFIGLFLMLGIGAEAQRIQMLDSAAQHYSDRNYEKAILLYESLISSGYESSELYYNLGNAYYKSNKNAYAIINYERANKISPYDEDIEFNLRLAYTHTVDKIEVIPEFFLSTWWSELMQLMSSNQWAILSISAFVLGLLGLLVFFLSRIVIARKVSFWLGVIFLILAVFSFNLSRKQYWLDRNEPAAIIITPSVVVKSSPADGGTELFLIHEGLKITVTDKVGVWREIKLSDGNEGWIKDDDLVII